MNLNVHNASMKKNKRCLLAYVYEEEERDGRKIERREEWEGARSERELNGKRG